MKIFIINLVSAIERHKFMQDQLERLGLEYEFFPAINGRELSKEELKSKVSREWSIIYEGRELGLAEIGCALSHLEIYKKIIQEQIEYALILEDDAWITPSINMVLKNIEEQKWGNMAEVILLSDGCKYGKYIINNHEYYSLFEVKGGYNAHAYIITQKGAQKLYDVLTPICHVADCWSWIVKHNLIRIRAIRPVLVTQNRSELGSSTVIGRENIQSKKIFFWFEHKIKRAWWKILDNTHILPYIHK